MTQQVEELKKDIQNMKRKVQKEPTVSSGVSGYNIAVTILTDLLGSIFIGCAIGLFLQKFFHTSVLLTAGLTLLGGIAGLYSTARYALQQEKKK